MFKGSVSKLVKKRSQLIHKYASYLDWHISPHANSRSPWNTKFTTMVVNDHAVASFSHHTWSATIIPASLSHRANDRRTCYRFFNFWPRGLPLNQSSPKGGWSTIHLDLPSYKIPARSRKWSMRYALPKFFFTFWPRGLTPGPKFTKSEDDLVDSEIYHPAKFHRPMSIHNRDIHYHVTKVLRTKKKQ